MMARTGRGDLTGRRIPAFGVLAARLRFSSGAGATWVGAVMTVALLWCHCAFAGEPRVLFLRGWFGVFSTGLDSVADDLRAKGIKAEVAGHLYWKTAVSDILRERATGKIGPLILVGHSQGANNVIDIARSLEPHNIPVDLLVTLAPFMQDPVPSNVVRAINYFQAPGWGAPLIPGPGFHGQLSNVDVGGDWTISHINIDKSAKLQAEISREITVLSQAKPSPEEVASSHSLPAGRSRSQE
jgi:hypothetical protein